MCVSWYQVSIGYIVLKFTFYNVDWVVKACILFADHTLSDSQFTLLSWRSFYFIYERRSIV